MTEAVKQRADVEVAPLADSDVPQAVRAFRLAFGTFLGVPDPETFAGDADFVSARWRLDPSAVFAAKVDGRLVGANFASSWGSFAFFGPLVVLPEFWGQGIAQRLLVPTMERFDRWGARQMGLFTFAHSPLHIALYQKFGFWPQSLTFIMTRPAGGAAQWLEFSKLNDAQRHSMLGVARELTDGIFPDLDVTRDIMSVFNDRLGDTIFLWEGDVLQGFAVCHCGAGTEAGSGNCYVKFGAARPGRPSEFAHLMDVCAAFAAARGLQTITAGVNSARTEAYVAMLNHGFRIARCGVAMQRPNTPGFNRPDVLVMDDWR